MRAGVLMGSRGNVGWGERVGGGERGVREENEILATFLHPYHQRFILLCISRMLLSLKCCGIEVHTH